jgi:hypothetical protein
VNNSELLGRLDELKSMMIDVATGGPRIDEVQATFARKYDIVSDELLIRGLVNPLPYRDLWEWYARWSSGDLPTWASRRKFVAELFAPLEKAIRSGDVSPFEPTGWDRVDRVVTQLRKRLASARNEEDFQQIGLLGREVLISLAQAVYDGNQHPILDGKEVSSTDFKRMRDADIAVELKGDAAEHLRKHAKAALDLAVHLQHKRTAAFRDAASCVEATTSVVNLIAITAGLRDPEGQ